MSDNFVRLVFKEEQDERIPMLFAAMTETALIKYVNEGQDSWNIDHYVTEEGDYVYQIGLNGIVDWSQTEYSNSITNWEPIFGQDLNVISFTN